MSGGSVERLAALSENAVNESELITIVATMLWLQDVEVCRRHEAMTLLGGCPGDMVCPACPESPEAVVNVLNRDEPVLLTCIAV